MTDQKDLQTSRRAFLSGSCLFLLANPFIGRTLRLTADDGEKTDPVLRIGLLTDVHYADKAPTGTRYHRDSIPKMQEAVSKFHDARCNFVVELGDFIDGAEATSVEIRNFRKIEAEFAAFRGERHHVVGNHCVWTLTKKQFLECCGQKQTYYSMNHGDFHFVVLDACFRKDGVPYGARGYDWADSSIPGEEREWLTADLSAASKPTVAFIHHRLDITGAYGVKNAPDVRKILEDSAKVLAVFQGHNHLNDHKEIGGIHYTTLAAMVEGAGKENNAYGILEVFADWTLRLDGFKKMAKYSLETRKAARV